MTTKAQLQDRIKKLKGEKETLERRIASVDERLHTRSRRIAEVLGEYDRLKIELDVLHGGPVGELSVGDMILVRARPIDGERPPWIVVQINDIEDGPEEDVAGDLTLLDCRTQEEESLRLFVGDIDIALMAERKAGTVEAPMSGIEGQRLHKLNGASEYLGFAADLLADVVDDWPCPEEGSPNEEHESSSHASADHTRGQVEGAQADVQRLIGRLETS